MIKVAIPGPAGFRRKPWSPRPDPAGGGTRRGSRCNLPGSDSPGDRPSPPRQSRRPPATGHSCRSLPGHRIPGRQPLRPAAFPGRTRRPQPRPDRGRQRLLRGSLRLQPCRRPRHARYRGQSRPALLVKHGEDRAAATHLRTGLGLDGETPAAGPRRIDYADWPALPRMVGSPSQGTAQAEP